MSHWAPVKPMNLNGLFSHETADEVHISKSEGPNRWKQQRDLDGSPYTRGARSALTPPLAGPKLTLDGLEKSVPAPITKSIDPDAVVKSYLEKSTAMGQKAAAVITKPANAALSVAKACDEDEPEADDLDKNLFEALDALHNLIK